ncbi:hypothetical protein [Halopenitus persicus]|uniref:Uncharacterized protein n=1 Tax=Halopenitus persicus TaxID=1048396 RepID=A0A1H3LGV4_9EURY|nr:hypothetical protein [Halopenitus persicus]SDY63164.1 hypothetical protein SAMN05216564_10762 [Halopenitus persicus]
MGGFKSGAADDDWGDTGTAPDAESTAETETSRPDQSNDFETPETHDSNVHSNSKTDRSSPTQGDLPWVLTRNNITDGRDQTVQLHLQQSTVDTHREAAQTIETKLGESVKKADLREAALLVGLQHTDEVAATLREWGYDLE